MMQEEKKLEGAFGRRTDDNSSVPRRTGQGGGKTQTKKYMCHHLQAFHSFLLSFSACLHTYVLYPLPPRSQKHIDTLGWPSPPWPISRRRRKGRLLLLLLLLSERQEQELPLLMVLLVVAALLCRHCCWCRCRGVGRGGWEDTASSHRQTLGCGCRRRMAGCFRITPSRPQPRNFIRLGGLSSYPHSDPHSQARPPTRAGKDGQGLWLSCVATPLCSLFFSFSLRPPLPSSSPRVLSAHHAIPPTHPPTPTHRHTIHAHCLVCLVTQQSAPMAVIPPTTSTHPCAQTRAHKPIPPQARS